MTRQSQTIDITASTINIHGAVSIQSTLTVNDLTVTGKTDLQNATVGSADLGDNFEAFKRYMELKDAPPRKFLPVKSTDIVQQTTRIEIPLTVDDEEGKFNFNDHLYNDNIKDISFTIFDKVGAVLDMSGGGKDVSWNGLQISDNNTNNTIKLFYIYKNIDPSSNDNPNMTLKNSSNNQPYKIHIQPINNRMPFIKYPKNHIFNEISNNIIEISDLKFRSAGKPILDPIGSVSYDDSTSILSANFTCSSIEEGIPGSTLQPNQFKAENF